MPSQTGSGTIGESDGRDPDGGDQTGVDDTAGECKHPDDEPWSATLCARTELSCGPV